MKKFLTVLLTMLFGLSMPGVWAMDGEVDSFAPALVLGERLGFRMKKEVELEVDPAFEKFMEKKPFWEKEDSVKKNSKRDSEFPELKDDFELRVDPGCENLEPEHMVLDIPEVEDEQPEVNEEQVEVEALTVDLDDTRTTLSDAQDLPTILEAVEVNGDYEQVERRIETRKQAKPKKAQKKKVSLTRAGVFAGLGLSAFGVLAKVCGKKWKLGKFFDACATAYIFSGPAVAATAYGIEKSGVLEKAKNITRDTIITARKVAKAIETGKKVVDLAKQATGVPNLVDGLPKDIEDLKKINDFFWNELARYENIENSDTFRIAKDDYSSKIAWKKFCLKKIEEAREAGARANRTDEYAGLDIWSFAKKTSKKLFGWLQKTFEETHKTVI